jgi:carnitine O-acetyltransferase
MEETKKVVAQFAQKDGPMLDAQLRKLDSEVPTSWIEGMWDTAYLEYRERTPINVNPAFMLDNEPASRESTQTDRAARLLESTAAFTIALRSGSLPVDKEGGKPICMSQYEHLLGAARIPVSGRDVLISNHSSTHVVVLAKRQYYVVNIIDPVSLKPIPSSQLKATLASIVSDSDAGAAPSLPTLPNVSVLTSDHRDTWADIYGDVKSLNPETIKAINDAIILVVLDHQSPADVDAAGAATLHNMGENRWFDKSLQLIVYKNAWAGVNMEHAGFDGQTLIRWLGDIAVDSLKLSSDSNSPVAALPLKKLTWKLNERIHVAIGRAQRDLEELVYKMDMKTMTFTKFGKNLITKHKVSPDAFAQLAFHLAYFRTYGTLRSAYESCSMKRFNHGRTECLRSLTTPLSKFVGLTQCPPSTASQQIASAKSSFDAHVTRAKQCQSGAGVDRHLWGMLQLAIHRRQHVPNYSLPALYSLPGWKRMRHDHLSTSNCGNEHLSYFGFGPTWSDGLGIGYIIKSDRIIAVVTSFDGTSPKFVANVETALQEIYDLFEYNKPVRTLRAKL